MERTSQARVLLKCTTCEFIMHLSSGGNIKQNGRTHDARRWKQSAKRWGLKASSGRNKKTKKRWKSSCQAVETIMPSSGDKKPNDREEQRKPTHNLAKFLVISHI